MESPSSTARTQGTIPSFGYDMRHAHRNALGCHDRLGQVSLAEHLDGIGIITK